MCGIAGLWVARQSTEPELLTIAGRMAAALAHRGPDDHGVWADAAAGVALGFRRLAILDLSPLGHQPMRSASGRYTIVFNGEVYNFRDLRRELEAAGATFRGRSDTEVILAAFERWGIERALRRFVGMFAMGVWDAERRTLSLIRDRLGIKPLFASSVRGTVAFGSELKALISGSAIDGAIDPSSVAQYLRYLYVPWPHTIYRDVIKLPPGSILTIRDPKAPLPAAEPYWRLEDAARAGLADGRLQNVEDAVERLDALLREAVGLRMIADVPLGALLSGGVDSSTVVAIMQAQSTGPVKTFTIGFDVAEHDEAGYARRVAERLGTEHTELYVSGRDALDVIPELPDMYDEPLANPSQIPTFLISRLARRDVTVALVGDGGDEVFGGYNRYVDGGRLLRTLRAVPPPLRRAGAAGLGALGVGGAERIHRAWERVVSPGRGRRLVADKFEKLVSVLHGRSDRDRYRRLLSAWPDPVALLRPGIARVRPDGVDDAFRGGLELSLVERMMLADQGAYLPEDLLAKVDRASMAVSLEVRVPLLDHRVVEFAWRMPLAMKIRNGSGKQLLRMVLDRYLPRSLVARPKVGFTVPIREWLRGPLRPWAEDLLSGVGSHDDGLFDREAMFRMWEEFQRGRRATGLRWWAVVHFLAWRARWGGRSAVAGWASRFVRRGVP